MMLRFLAALLMLLSLPHGCSSAGSEDHVPPRHPPGPPTQTLAIYEAWFGHPHHITITYNSHDPVTIRKQIRAAKDLGISGFVVDWYGYREPFEDRSYALMQTIAAEENFHVALLYDEGSTDEGATDSAIEDFKLFYKSYLAPSAPGRQAYLTYQGRPVIFVFPTSHHTDWTRVRAELNKWPSSPILIDEYPPGTDSSAFDGYYAWVSPGPKGWSADGSNWGQQYLEDFYKTMDTKYPDKLAVAGAWASFDDAKASWGQNRHMDARCGQTFADTYNLFRQHSPANDPLPYLLIETWNDYEEGTAVEGGIPRCPQGFQPLPLPQLSGAAPATPASPPASPPAAR